MHKYKCSESGCSHTAETKGFCPVHGKELSEVSPLSSEMQELLKSIESVVDGKTREVMKQMGFDGTPREKILGASPKTSAEKLEYTKGLLSETDLKMFNAIHSDKQADFLKKARIGLFFKHLVAFASTHDPEHLKHVKALSEGDNASGGYLVPTEFRATLVEDLLDQPVLRNLVTVIPMATDSLELPVLASNVKVSWGSENTSISTTTARFGNLTFAPKRLNTMMYTSRELVADSAIQVVPLISRLFSEAIGREEDRVIMVGSGTGQPKGIFQETLAGIDNNNDDTAIVGNLLAIPFRLPKAYRRNARYVMTSLAREKVASLRDSTNQPIFKTGLEGKTPDTIAGYPVVEQNDMSVDKVLFGDLSYYYLADREQVSVETTTEGAGTFEKHQVAIKIVERIDGKVAVVNAFRQITNCGFD